MSTSKLEKITGEPDHNHAVARCFGANGRTSWGNAPRAHEGHGVTWKHKSGASLRNLKCPIDGGPLYQTTRGWTGAYEWTVIPEDVVAAAAGVVRNQKKLAVQAKLDAGTHKLVRDLQPGDVVVSDNRRGGFQGKIVEISKEGGKFRVVVSRSREAVVRGYLYHGDWKTDELNERADKLEQLTTTWTGSGTQVAIVDPVLFRWVDFAKPSFGGWATDHPGSTLAELWDREVKRWTAFIEDKSYIAAVSPQSRFETEEKYLERKEKARLQTIANKEQAERALQVAIDRLVRHTGSAVTSA